VVEGGCSSHVKRRGNSLRKLSGGIYPGAYPDPGSAACTADWSDLLSVRFRQHDHGTRPVRSDYIVASCTSATSQPAVIFKRLTLL